MKYPISIVALATVVAATSRAATSGPLPESLLACTQIKDPSDRVSCYDTQVAAITAGHKTATPPAAVRAPPPAAPTTLAPVASAPSPAPVQFGDEQLPNKARANPVPKDEALLSSITELQTVGQKIYLITLANGQVWRQQGSQLPALFRVGNEVRIERGALGSYHLSTVAFGDKNWVLVTRTR